MEKPTNKSIRMSKEIPLRVVDIQKGMGGCILHNGQALANWLSVDLY